MTRHLKLFAALLVVLLTISGFSPARSSSGSSGGKSRSSSGGSSGGGGCSSKKSSSHNNYRHDDDDDDDYGSSSSSSGGTNSRPSPTRSPSTRVVTCAGDGRTEAQYEVRNRNTQRHTYTLHVDFLDAGGELVDEGSEVFSVAGSGTTTVNVEMDNPDRSAQVASCEIDRVS